MGETAAKGRCGWTSTRRPEEVEARRALVMSSTMMCALCRDGADAGPPAGGKGPGAAGAGKPRDLYDIWLLLNQGVRPDNNLIERKLALYQMGGIEVRWKRPWIRPAPVGSRTQGICCPSLCPTSSCARG